MRGAAAGAAGVGGEHRFAVVGQRNFPAFLPAAERQQVGFALRREIIRLDPETDGRIRRVELRGIGGAHAALYAVEIESAVRPAEAVLGKCGSVYRRMVGKGGLVFGLARKVVTGYRRLRLQTQICQEATEEQEVRIQVPFHILIGLKML